MNHTALRNLAYVLALASLAASGTAVSADAPFTGYWEESQADAILAKTLTVRLAPDLSALSPGARQAIDHLIAAGKIMEDLYEDQRHPQALEARRALADLDARGLAPHRTAKLLDLYRLSKGPIATTLDNDRKAFLPVAPEVPGKNVYPADLSRGEMDRYLEAHPEQRDALMGIRTVVRRATMESLQRDLGVLRSHPVLDTLHPGLRSHLEALGPHPSRSVLYAVPYSVAWPDRILRVYDELNLAAAAIEGEDADFARYLRLRGRDLLADDYDGGDAAWVTGRFGNLNAQIGSYETYDDELYGVKTFFSLSILERDAARSDALRSAVKGLQVIEDMLPYDAHKRVREDIPIGVYDVVADFGQARGRNTASILPNESHLARQYGRTILLRANIMAEPQIFDIGASAYRAAVLPEFREDFTPEGQIQRTLWHEIGHYLGVDRTADGRELDDALGDSSDLYEEMKADLVSLFAVEPLRKQGYYDDATARSVYACGIRRVLQKVRPRRVQPYQTMELMQWNWLLEHGVLEVEPSSGLMHIHYDRYPEAVRSLLAKVLAIQRAGDKQKAEDFIRRWTHWDDAVQGALAAKMLAAEKYRDVLIHYAAMGE